MRTKKIPRAYLLREIAELALVIGVLVVVSQFARIPVWAWVGIPLAKAFASITFYGLFLRRALIHLARSRSTGRSGPPSTIRGRRSLSGRR